MKKLAGNFSCVIGILISCIILFAKWLYFYGTAYSIFDFYSTVKTYGGISKFAAATEGASLPSGVQSIMPAYILLVLPLMIVVLLLLRTVLLLLHKEFKRMEYLSYAAYSIGFIYLLTMGMTAYTPTFMNLAALLLLVPDYLGARFIMEKDEMARKAYELKRQEKLALADKKRRMYFPGKYPKDFYEVVFANFKSNLKSYLLFIIAASVFFALLYVLNGTQIMLGILNPKQSVSANSQVLNSLHAVSTLVLGISTLLLILILSNYIKTRMKNYGIFINLGIRKKTLWLIITLEYLACIIVSLIIGFILGNLFLPFIRLFYAHSMNLPALVSVPYGMLTLTVCITFLITIGLATLINYHLFEGIDITSSFVIAAKKERLPSHFLLIGLVFGCFCALSSIRNYLCGTQLEEVSQLFLLLFGVLFILYCGGTLFLKWYMKKEDRYLRNLFKILPWKYRFRTNAKYWFLLFAVQLLLFCVYLPQLSACLIAQPEKDLYPYNYVCLAHEGDDAFYNGLKAEFNVKLHIYPMVRVNTLLAEPYTLTTLAQTPDDGMVSPMGQHIGISESTYMKLKALTHPDDKKKLHLKGKEIHIVFQQGTAQRARRLDWYDYPIGKVDTSGPHIKVGDTSSYDLTTRDKLYPVYHVKSRERLILTGMTDGGDAEDIVVFSDAYFNQLEKKVTARLKGEPTPTRLVTLQTSKSNDSNVAMALTSYLEQNADISHLNPKDFPCYAKTSALPAAIGERFIKEIGFWVTALILIISSLFTFYLKYNLETDDLTHRSKLLGALGMNLEERKKILRTEMRAHAFWTYLTALILSVFFWAAIPVTRFFHAKETMMYYVVFAILTGLYTLVYALVMYRIEKHFIIRSLME